LEHFHCFFCECLIPHPNRACLPTRFFPTGASSPECESLKASAYGCFPFSSSGFLYSQNLSFHKNEIQRIQGRLCCVFFTRSYGSFSFLVEDYSLFASSELFPALPPPPRCLRTFFLKSSVSALVRAYVVHGAKPSPSFPFFPHESFLYGVSLDFVFRVVASLDDVSPLRAFSVFASYSGVTLSQEHGLT